MNDEDFALSEAQEKLTGMESEETGSCDSCEAAMINKVRVHEHGCPRYARLLQQKRIVERLEDQ